MIYGRGVYMTGEKNTKKGLFSSEIFEDSVFFDIVLYIKGEEISGQTFNETSLSGKRFKKASINGSIKKGRLLLYKKYEGETREELKMDLCSDVNEYLFEGEWIARLALDLGGSNKEELKSNEIKIFFRSKLE